LDRKFILIVLWFFIFVGYYFYRSSLPILIRDDTSRIYALQAFPSLTPSQYLEVAFGHYEDRDRNDPSKLYLRELPPYDEFIGGYRPLSTLYAFVFGFGILQGTIPVAIPIALTGIFLATGAICIFFAARRFVRSDAAAYFASFLFTFSVPVITGALVVFAGVQAILPLLMCLGLLFYWGFIESPRFKSLFLAGLCLVLLIGPWFREFLAVLPVLIIILEYLRARKFTRLMGLAAIFLLHGIFPMALPKISYSGLHIQPVFAIGSLSSMMDIPPVSSPLLAFLITLRFDIGSHLISLLPPTLWLLAVIGAMVLVVSRKKRGLYHLDPPDLRGFLFVILWFLLTFLPFLKLFYEQVHLAYALLPASILIAMIVERMAMNASSLRPSLRVRRFGFTVILLVIIADHALNIYSVYIVTRDIGNGILDVSSWLTTNIPKDSAVISNGLQLVVINYYAGHHIDPFWTNGSGLGGESRKLETSDRLEQFLKDNSGKRDVYFLDVNFDYPSDALPNKPLNFVRAQSVDMQDLGIVHITQTKYLFLDPLKAVTQRPYISFPSGPDLQNDFYRGPAQDGTLLTREVYAEYHLYKITGTTVKPLPN